MKQDGKEFSPASNAMLQQAADGELVLWVFIRRHTAKLLAFSLAVAPTQEPTKATRSCAAGLVPIMPELANELMGFPSAKLKNYRATDPSDCPDSHPWKDYYWVLDEPQAVTLEQVYFQGVTVASAGDDPSPDLPATEALPRKRAPRRTWFDVTGSYLVETYKAGQYATTKDFYKALVNKAGPNSPFDKGIGANSHNLFVRDIGKPLTLKTLENKMPVIRLPVKAG